LTLLLEPTRIASLLNEHPGSPIFITTHHKPDADALGSSLALYHLLKKLGHQPTVVTPTDYPAFLNWMPGERTVVNFEANQPKAKAILDKAEIVFCLDFNDVARLNEMGNHILASHKPLVLIDHHREPKEIADYTYWTLDTSSTCELIYWLMEDCGWMHLMDRDIGSCLYAGIMTDTGSFRYTCTSSRTHAIVAKLMEAGVDSSAIHDLVFDNFSIDRYRMMGYVLYEKLEIIPEYRTALVYLSQEELLRFNVQTGDTEGFVNFGLGVENIVFSVLIVDRTKVVKMSFRSKGHFPCHQVASKYFNGGGHLNASGGSSNKTLDETVKDFRRILPEFKELLLREP
jgi:phosphoesterase RecJ-like protein